MALSEFDIIRYFFDRPQAADGRSDVLLGIGDDAAVVTVPDDHELALCMDTLVAGVHLTKEESSEPDAELAQQVVWNAVGRGLMLFAPVGLGGGTVKLCPPLCITKDAVVEGVSTLAEAFADCLP